jgi:hypothetical protein
VRLANGSLKYGSGDSGITWADANADSGNCWAR